MSSTKPDICPNCSAHLEYEHIDRDGIRRDYSRRVGVEIGGVYDGILFWACPDCGGTWNRWPEDHPRWVVAERYRAEWRAAS